MVRRDKHLEYNVGDDLCDNLNPSVIDIHVKHNTILVINVYNQLAQ